MSTIDTSYASYANIPGNAQSAASAVPSKTLGQNEFLKLLVTQMTSQDPMNPMTDTSFIAQMAQFTSLEQARSMQSDMSLLQANNMIGRQVSLIDQGGKTVTGIVGGVQISEGTPQIIVNGQAYGVDTVFNISAAPTQQN